MALRKRQHYVGYHLITHLTCKRTQLHYIPIAILAVIVFLVSTTPSPLHPPSLDWKGSIASALILEPESFDTRTAQEDFNETSDDEDASIIPVIVSGLIIIFLVTIISYITLKEQERQKRIKKKMRREERRIKRRRERELARKEEFHQARGQRGEVALEHDQKPDPQGKPEVSCNS